MKKIILIVVVAVFAMPSCKKYEEGPTLSLRSKKARIVGEWMLESVTRDGVDITTLFLAVVGSEYEMHLEKDGAYHTHGLFEDDGTWVFEDKKEKIKIQSSFAGVAADELTILKLKNSELWLQNTYSDGTYIFHYKQ